MQMGGMSRREMLRNSLGFSGAFLKTSWAQLLQASSTPSGRLIWNDSTVKTADGGSPATYFDAGRFTSLFDQLERTVRKDRSEHLYQGKIIHANPTWVRDHIHEMKGYKFWESDLSTFIDTLISLQQPDGFFFEILTDPTNEHPKFVTEKFRRIDAADNIAWVRLELEADVEYLMVEGAYNIWQATGDLDATKHRLPALDRGLRYCFTHPTRWDARRGALKRTFTIDTWDFTYGQSTYNRRIDPGMPMGIMHGDNSGLYQACRQLAAMYRAAGEADLAQEWEQKGADLRDCVNRLCFNGRFYTHQILLQPVDTGVSEEDILSLSNTYDINRGLPTHEMALKILDEYARRRKEREQTDFAEWFSIDPPYPQFGPYKAGQYINGGIAAFVAGELAKAAFEHGQESYGADILNRVEKMVTRDGDIHFLYTMDGKDQGGGPSGWSAAAVQSALIEGLAGIRDEDVLFRRVTVSPRFIAAGIDYAEVCTRYGPSNAWIAIKFDHNAKERTIRIRLAGVSKEARLRILMPVGSNSAKVVSPKSLQATVEPVEQSLYAVVPLATETSRGPMDVTIHYV
jgi:hypothetical protein